MRSSALNIYIYIIKCDPKNEFQHEYSIVIPRFVRIV